MVEIGCGKSLFSGLGFIHAYRCIGAGNTVYPVLNVNKNPDLSLHAFDYSSHAVKLVQVHLATTYELILTNVSES